MNDLKKLPQQLRSIASVIEVDFEVDKHQAESRAALIREAAEKLAAYEDTGLSPEEIRELTHSSYGPLHKKLGTWIDAERDGKLLILPCNAGREAYSIRYGEIEPATIWQVEINSYTSPAVWIRFTIKSKVLGNIDGHTRIDLAARDGIYFTREEAEAALKGAAE